MDDRALQELGEQLVALSARELDAVPMPEELADAVRRARQASRHGARRRQLQYIGALMRQVDAAPIRTALQQCRRGDDRRKAVFKQLEVWRDALLRGDSEVVETVLTGCPAAERRRLLILADKARQAAGSPQAVRASRDLFRYMRATREEKPDDR